MFGSIFLLKHIGADNLQKISADVFYLKNCIDYPKNIYFTYNPTLELCIDIRSLKK